MLKRATESFLVLTLIGGTLRCGGMAQRNGAGADGSVEDGGLSDVALSPCGSPSGFAVCGGPRSCPATTACHCMDLVPSCDAGVSICQNEAALPWSSTCFLCPDGEVCVEPEALCVDGGKFVAWCYPFEVGSLFAANGGAAQVRYADYSAWTGDPLPTPATCPAFVGFTICGGHCGGCAAGEVCTGRSPLHPYGVCVPPSAIGCVAGNGNCVGGSGCFTFTVQASVQGDADQDGVCLPLAQCQAIAANLPGGGRCTM